MWWIFYKTCLSCTLKLLRGHLLRPLTDYMPQTSRAYWTKYAVASAEIHLFIHWASHALQRQTCQRLGRRWWTGLTKSDRDLTWCLTKTQFDESLPPRRVFTAFTATVEKAPCFCFVHYLVHHTTPWDSVKEKLFTILIKMVRQTLLQQNGAYSLKFVGEKDWAQFFYFKKWGFIAKNQSGEGGWRMEHY